MRYLHCFALLLLALVASAQQELVFSQFFYNKLLLNPGAAGSNGHPSLTAFHRQQWVGLEGAPLSQSLSFSTPAFADRVGLGLTLVNDRIGFFHSTFVNLAYAYRMQFGQGRLGLGMQASYLHHLTDWNKAKTITGQADPAAGTEGFKPLFNVGIGAHFETDRFYAGFSMPYLLEGGLLEGDGSTAANPPGASPTLFLNLGLLVEISPTLKMRPALAARILENAPPSLDAHLSFGFLKNSRLWAGGTFRWSRNGTGTTGDALVAILQYQSGLRWKAGFAYDIALSNLRRDTQGTFELMLEYSLLKQGAAVRNPRFF